MLVLTLKLLVPIVIVSVLIHVLFDKGDIFDE